MPQEIGFMLQANEVVAGDYVKHNFLGAYLQIVSITNGCITLIDVYPFLKVQGYPYICSPELYTKTSKSETYDLKLKLSGNYNESI